MNDHAGNARDLSTRFSSTNQPRVRGRGIARVGIERIPANRVVVATECSFYWTEQGGPPVADNSPMVECHECGTFNPRPVCTMRYGIGLSTDRAALTLAHSYRQMMEIRQRLMEGGAVSVVVVMVGFCPECEMTDPDAIAEQLSQLDYRITPATLAHLK